MKALSQSIKEQAGIQFNLYSELTPDCKGELLSEFARLHPPFCYPKSFTGMSLDSFLRSKGVDKGIMVKLKGNGLHIFNGKVSEKAYPLTEGYNYLQGGHNTYELAEIMDGAVKIYYRIGGGVTKTLTYELPISEVIFVASNK